MKILDRYLVKNFLFYLIGGTFLFIFIFIIVDLSDNLTSYIEGGRKAWEIFLIYIYQVPSLILLLFPVGALVALFFTIGIMVKNNELTAIKSAGISIYRFLYPIFLLMFLLSIILFLFNESVVVKSNKRYRELKDRDSFSVSSIRDFNVFQNKNILYKGEFFSLKNNTANKAEFYEYDKDNKIKKIMFCENAKYADNRWNFKKPFQISLEDGKASYSNEVENISILLSVRPSDILVDKENIDIYNVYELSKTAVNVKRSGYDYRRQLTEISYRFYYILVSIIIILIGSSFVVNIKNTGVVFGLSISILISFVYWGVLQSFRSVSENGYGNPFILLMIPNLLFLFVGISLLVYSRK